MKKIIIVFFLLISIISFGLEFNISVNYKLNASFLPSTIVYPLNVNYMIEKGYMVLTKGELPEKSLKISRYYFISKLPGLNSFSSLFFLQSSNIKKASIKFAYVSAKKISVRDTILSLHLNQISLQKPALLVKRFIKVNSSFSIMRNTIAFPQLISYFHYVRIVQRKFLPLSENINVLTNIPEEISAKTYLLPLKNLSPKFFKSIYLSKNSYLSFYYGKTYDFDFSVPFPLDINYNGTNLKVISEYGALTMESTRLSYSYSLAYNFDNSFSIEANMDTKIQLYNALLSYSLDNLKFSAGLSYNYNKSSILPIAELFYNNSYLTFDGTSLKASLVIPYGAVNITYSSTISWNYYFYIKNWRFSVGYGKDLNFMFATGFNYYVPITIEIGFDDNFFVNFEAIYSGYDFGINTLKRKVYLKINKNL